MPLRESEAIILRTFPLGEGDLLVTFLSRTAGRMKGVASGARRIKSRFGAALEPASYVRIWVFENQARELVRIRQCELVESFLNVLKNYEAGVALAAVCEISDAVLPEHDVNDDAFRLLLMTAQTMKASGQFELPLSYFALWTVRLAGWLPSLERCNRCGREFGKGAAFGSGGRAGFLCGDCRKPGMRTISPRSLAGARRMLEERLDGLAQEDWPYGPMSDITDFALDVVEHQVERKLTTRRLLKSAREAAIESKGKA